MAKKQDVVDPKALAEIIGDESETQTVAKNATTETPARTPKQEPRRRRDDGNTLGVVTTSGKPGGLKPMASNEILTTSKRVK